MPKPIIITEDMKEKALDEFSKMLKSLKMPDGRICYAKSFKYKDSRAILWLSQTAYRKTVALVTAFSDEVAWHGTVSRQSKNEFLIEDIFVYPQEVTGITVNTDWGKYTDWLYGFGDEDFKKIRMQGHSHVSMGVSPSVVDDAHRLEILGQLDPDMFYIFMIWNKSLNTHALIYDMQSNVLYEDGDIDVKVINDEPMDAFLSDAMEKVQKKKPAKYKVKRSDARTSWLQESLYGDCNGYGGSLHG